MAFRTKKISQMDPKGANLASTDLLEISELVSGSYVTKSITGAEIVAGATTGLVPTTRTISTTSPLSGGGDLSANRTLSIATANTTTTGALSSTDWNTFNGKQAPISLTTTGTGAATFVANVLNVPTPAAATFTSLTTTGSSGSSTLTAGVLNVPTYSLSGLGGVPTTRTLTINGTTQDLSADRTFTISTGITIGTTPITSGTVGRVLFEGTGNVVQESANLFWDNTNVRLGVGTATPNYTLELKNTTGGATTPSLSFVTSTYNSQIIVGNSTYPYALGANSLNVYHGVAGGIGFYNGSASPTLRFSILSDGKTIVGSATTATRIFEVNNTVNGGGIGLNSSAINTSYAIVHTATGANSWAFNSAGTGSSQTAGTLSIGATTNNMLLFSNGNTVLGALGSADAGYKLDVNGTARVTGLITAGGGLTWGSAPNDSSLSNGGAGTNAINISRRGISLSNGADNGILLDGGNGASSISRIYIGGGAGTQPLCINGNAREVVFGSDTATSNASSLVRMVSTTKGFLPPVMTTTQKNAIASPTAGLMVYDTTLNLMALYNGTIWTTL